MQLKEMKAISNQPNISLLEIDIENKLSVAYLFSLTSQNEDVNARNLFHDHIGTSLANRSSQIIHSSNIKTTDYETDRK